MLGESFPLLSLLWPYILTFTVGYVISRYLTQHFGRNQGAEQMKTSGEDNRPKDIDEFVFLDKADDMWPEDIGNENVESGWDVKQIPYRLPQYPEDQMIKRSRQFYQEANRRRTCRFFSTKDVPREVINNLILTAGTAPSGAHTEPWTYVVVSNKELKSKIRHIVEEEEEMNYAKRMGQQWTDDLIKLRTNHQKPYIDHAPYIVLVFKQSYGVRPDGSRKTHYYNELSVAVSVGILLAAIQHVGLVTVTSTPMNAGPQIRNLVGRPVNEKLILLLPIGFPAEDATVPDLYRKSLSDIMVTMD